MKTIKNLLVIGALLLSNLAFSQGTETRKVLPFTRLSVEGSINTVLTKGNEESVRIEAENIELNKVLIEQKDGGLRIYIKKENADNVIKNILKRGINQVIRVKVYVTYKTLEKINRAGSGNFSSSSDLNVSEIANSGSGNMTFAKVSNPNLNISTSGSGNINVSGIESSSLKLSISGSGSIKVDGGTVQKQTISVAGSGKINAPTLKSDECNVSIAGSGNANVFANKTISGNIAGSGNINYHGDATIAKVSTAGSGRIRKQG